MSAVTGCCNSIVGTDRDASTVSEAVFTTPFTMAVRTAVSGEATDSTGISTETLFTPAGTVNAPGAVTFRLSLVSTAGTPEAGVGELKFSVQLEWVGPMTVLGLQARLSSFADDSIVTGKALLTPPAVAVTVTV